MIEVAIVFVLLVILGVLPWLAIPLLALLAVMVYCQYQTAVTAKSCWGRRIIRLEYRRARRQIAGEAVIFAGAAVLFLVWLRETGDNFLAFPLGMAIAGLAYAFWALGSSAALEA